MDIDCCRTLLPSAAALRPEVEISGKFDNSLVGDGCKVSEGQGINGFFYLASFGRNKGGHDYIYITYRGVRERNGYAFQSA